ncbi:MAG: 30S ribosomal protein S8e [Nanoarchaeota archaeon]|nr:30S ribosomal protein S8e [Nanoarchaeota archaeon]
MAILQLRSRRKNTGGRYIRPLVKRLSRLGGLPVFTKLGETKSKTLRVIGGNDKDKLLAVNKANLYDPTSKKHQVVAIKNIVENPANRHYVRRNILTKGSIVETEKGRARITSRPGQSAFVNATLLTE